MSTFRTVKSISLCCGLLIISSIVVSGCFITNCPPGGKRSGISNTELRKCESCGPPGFQGRCYGPQICCSLENGCYFGTPETLNCILENRYTTLCKNPGDPCGGSSDTGSLNGQCASDGVCCTPETCTFDDACRVENPEQKEESNQKIVDVSAASVPISLPKIKMPEGFNGRYDLIGMNQIPKSVNSLFQQVLARRLSQMYPPHSFIPAHGYVPNRK